jgi:hypothetical protein
MDIQVRKLTQAEADALRKQYQDSIKPAVGVMKLWATEENFQQHLREVAEIQAAGHEF